MASHHHGARPSGGVKRVGPQESMTQPHPRYDVIDDAMAAVLAQKTEQQRLEIAFGMWRSARAMIQAIVAAEHPDWSEAEVQKAIARRMSHGAV